jgi:hypothetical protein
VTVHMHVEHPRIFEKEMVVQRRHLDSVLQKGAHDGIHLIFEKDQITHHHFLSTHSLRHCQPTTETEGSGSADAIDCHLDVIPRYVDLQNIPSKHSL